MKKITVLITVLIAIFSGCKKDNSNVEPEKFTIKETRVLSQDEKNLVEKMKKAAFALKETMKKDKELRGLFKDEIQVLYKKSDWKEAFSFKQLLNPQEPVYSSLKSAKTSGVSSKLSAKFTAGFIKNLKLANDGLKRAALPDVTTEMDGLQVYYPYSEEFIETQVPNYTYTYAPLTNDAVNYGYVYDAVTDQDMEVIIDDVYAFKHPTLIVMPEDYADSTPIAIDPIPIIPVQQSTINQLSVGSVQCDRQYGELFTGGPDLRFVAFLPGDAEKAYTTADQIFGGRSLVKPIKFSRSQVRNHVWREFNYPFISNWRPEYITTHWGIWEDDSHNFGHNWSTLSFDTKTTYKLVPGVERTNDFKIDIKDVGNDKVGEVTWDREAFLALNNYVPTETYFGIPPYEVLQDPTTGKKFRIYIIGAVHFTLPNFQYNVQ